MSRPKGGSYAPDNINVDHDSAIGGYICFIAPVIKFNVKPWLSVSNLREYFLLITYSKDKCLTNK